MDQVAVRVHRAIAVIAVSLFSLFAIAGVSAAAPDWNHGNGATYAPATWPSEPADPADCGANCGDWKPYTRFNRSLNDPRVKDPSNGGTAPQNYVNVASSCSDKAQPSIYYYLKQVDPADPSKDVIMFRWRVEQIANTYATGSNAGAYSSGDPWSSALWTVLFDLGGSGFRDLAAHLNGSSGSPSAPVDMLAGVYGRIPTQSIDYINDPANIQLLAQNPTAFIDGPSDGGSGGLLNFHNSATPNATWANGSAETVWDYGTSRAIRVSTRPCTEFFVDYQIPVAMLDASAHGGPKVDRSTPISMLFCTANSLNNPFQKDCALNRGWQADPAKPGPFGDYVSFDQTKPYVQPIIKDVTAEAPASCGSTYALKTTVQDTLAVVNGEVVPSVKVVTFWYYYDADGNGISDDGREWTLAADATLVAGTMNKWQANWDSSALPKGRYLIGVQAVDDDTALDDDMTPTGVDNRTFSYVTSNAMGEVYVDEAWATGVDGTGHTIDFPANFPNHFPALTRSAAENWYGNPAITGVQVATTGVDLAINACGVAPALTKSADLDVVSAGQTITYTLNVSNPAANPNAITLTQLQDVLPAGFTFTGITGGTLTPSTGPVSGATGTLTWGFSSVAIAPGASKSLVFTATAPAVTGTYTNTATAETSFGTVTSNPLQSGVGAARLTIGARPSAYSVAPGDTLTYTVTYANDSPVNAEGVVLINTLPADVTYVPGSCTGGCADDGAGTLTWPLGHLAAGEGPYTITFQATVASPYAGAATSQDSATIDADNTDPSSATASVYVAAPRAQLTLRVTTDKSLVDPAALSPDNQVTFTITYSNVGDAAASGVVLSNPLPAGFTFDAASGTYSNSGGTVTWNLGSLAVGASGSVTVTAHPANPYSSGDPNPAADTATLSAADAGSVSASASVGVKQSGTLCTNYYFTSTNAGFGGGPINKLATTTTPAGTPGAVPGTIALPKSAETVIAYFLQDPISASEIDFSTGASTLSGQFIYTKVTTGNLTLKVTTYDYDPATGNKTQLGTPATYTDNGSGSAPFPLEAGAVTGTLAKGHRLLWVVSGVNDTTTKTPQIEIAVDSPGTYVQVCAQPPANLLLDKSVSAGSLNLTGAGRTLTYTLSYANTSGATSATNAVLSDVLPAGTTYASSSPAATTTPGVGNNGTVTWNLGTIAPNGSGTATVTVDVADDLTGNAALENTASLVSDQTVTTSDSATTAVTGGGDPAGTPNVIVSLGTDKTLLKPGETVTYTLTVVNAGSKAATGVAITDVVPANGWFTYVGSSIAGGDSRSVSGNTLGWTIASMAPGASATLSFQMRVASSGAPDGVTTLDDHATLTYGGGGTGAATSNTVTLSVSTNANLALTLSASAPADGIAFAPSQEIEYTLTLGNTGSAAASNVVVHNPIPDHTSFVAITAGTGSYDAVENRIGFPLATLPAGASNTFKFKVRVTATLDAGTTTITDTATANASNASSREAQASSVAKAEPAVTLIKSGPASMPLPAATLAVAASGSQQLTVSNTALLAIGDYLRISGTVTRITAIAGQVITVDTAISASSGVAVYRGAVYNLTYRNNGTAAASNVVVSDTLPAGLLYVTSSPTAGTHPAVGAAGLVRWTIGTVAAGASGTVQVVAVPTTSGSLVNNGQLTYGTDPAPCATCTSTVTTGVGGLTVSKTTTTGAIAAGGIASYVITLTNSLASDVSGVSVTDRLPGGFTYRSGSGSPTPSSVTDGLPTWNGLTVPANGTLVITFDADVAAGSGSATYQNELEVSGPVGVTAFDPLASTREDVTLVAPGAFVIDGYVFRDADANGSRDASDPGLEGIAVEINDDPHSVPYMIYTDSTGYFRQTVGGGIWTISVAGSNAALLSGLRLLENYPATPQASAARTVQFGYVSSGTPAPTSHALAGTVFHDVDGDGVMDADETGNNAGGIHVVVVDATHSVVAVSDVTAAGSWNATVLSATGYVAYLSTDAPPIGALRVPAVTAPAGWRITDDNDGIRIVDATNDRAGLDFAIHQDKADVYAAIVLPSTVDNGGTLRALLTFGNRGDLTADGVTYKITGLPTGLAGVTCSGASCTYDAINGEVTVSGLPGSLSAGQTAQLLVTFVAPTGGDLSLVAAITTTTAGDPAPNNSATATAHTGAATAEVATTVVAPAAANGGDDVTAMITFVNLGGTDATAVEYVLAGSEPLTLRNGATPCTLDGVTHALTGCAPSTLAAGESVRLTAGFSAPNVGSVTLDARVNAANDVDGSNNQAAAVTRVVTTTDADLTASVATATHAGSAAVVTAEIVFANLGPAAASAISYAIGFTGADAAAVTGVSCTGATCLLGAGGNVTVTGLPTTLAPGETATITLAWTGPNAGTVGVAASIATIGTEGNTANNSAAATTVFTASDYTVAVSADPAAGGSVSGAGTYQAGDDVTVTATANAGYSFLRWSEGGSEVATTASYGFVATGNRTLVASFTTGSHTVTFVTGDHGTRSGGGDLNQAVNHGDDAVAPTVLAQSGWSFSGWDSDFTHVTADLTVTARYVKLAQHAKVLTTGSTVNVPVTGSMRLTGFSSLRGGVQTDYPTPTAADYGSLLARNADGTWSFTAYQSGRYTFTFVDPATGDITTVTYTIYPHASFATAQQTVAQNDVATVRVLLDDLPLDDVAMLPYGVANAVLGMSPAPADLFTRNPATLDFDTAAPAVTCSTSGGCYMDLKFTAAADSGSVVFTLKKEGGLVGARLGAITTHTVNIVPPGSAPLQADLELDPGHVVVVGHAPMVATVTELPLAAGRHFRFDWSDSDGDLQIGAVNASSVTFTAPSTVGVYSIRVTVTDLDFPGRAPIHLQTWVRTIAVGGEAAACNGDCDTDTTRIPSGDQDPVCALGAGDPVAIPYRLQVGDVPGFDNTGLCLETSPGYGLRLGTVSFVAAPNYGAGVDNRDVDAYGRDGQAPADASDTGYSHLGINYDFEVIQLESAGQAVAVVVPLPWGTTIPANAVWRKFHPTNGWFTFHAGNGNAVDSAPRRSGACPSPIATTWRSGLVPGYECVRLTIVDGGTNDLDGTADGVIRDPGTLAAPVSDGWVVNSSGGTGSVDLFVLLGGGLALLWRRRRAFLLLLVLPLTVRAHLEEGWYAGGTIGQARGSVDASDVENRLADLGLTGGDVSVSNNRTAWRLFAGRQFDDTWSGELGYTNLGVVKTRITGYSEDPAPYLAQVNGVAPHSGKGPEIALMGRHWLSDDLFVYIRGGLFVWEAQYDANLDRGGFANEPHSGRSPVVGIGAEYAARGPWAARAGWDRYRLAGEEIDVVGLGVVYRFGSSPAVMPVAAPVIAEPAPDPAPMVEAPAPPAPAIAVPAVPVVPAAPSAPVPAISWIVRYDFDGSGHVNYQDVIASLSEFLRTHPQARVELVGHTDSFGSKAYNARLSTRRAQGLRHELVKRGIDPRRISAVKGVGASQPVADNTTDAGRALNRRTEINVYDGEGTE